MAPKNRGQKRHRKTGTFEAGWNSQEIVRLRGNADLGAAAVAAKLGRSVDSVRSQARRQRVSLRRRGETRGRLLGQPNSSSFLEDRTPTLQQLRADVIAGRVDLARIEHRVQLIASGAPLCPGCVRLPIEVVHTGLCLPCHLLALAESHAAELKALQAKRVLDKERQAKHRLKVWAEHVQREAGERLAGRAFG